MGRATLIFLVIFFMFTSLANAESASTHEKKANASLAGYSGLWDMPNARVMKDWNVRIGASVSRPYYYYYGTLGLFDRLEINGRIITIEGLYPLTPDYGRYKDKSIDAKLLLIKESEWTPAIAIGVTDVHGTGLFTSRYLALSKKFGPLDITYGIGQGTFSGKIAKDLYSGSRRAERYLASDDTEFEPFGGVELFVTKNLSLLAEYTPIKYEKLLGGNEADWPFTFGFKYSLWDTLYFSGAYARGEELSAGVFLQFPLEAEGLLAWKKEPDPKPWEETLLKASEASEEELARIIVEALQKDGFGNVKVMISIPKIWVEFANTKYNSPGLALRRVFLVVDSIAPVSMEKVYLVLTRNNGIFQVGLVSTRDHLRTLVESKKEPKGILKFAYLSHSSKDLWRDFLEHGSSPKEAKAKPSRFHLSFKPQVRTFWNDPSGFLKTRVSLDVRGGFTPWKGGLLAGSYSIPVQNDISTSARVDEPEASRTDIVDYLGRDDPSLWYYGFDQIFELPGDCLGRVDVGAYDFAYAGVGGELFRYFLGGRFGLGLEGTLSRKRDPDDDFRLLEENKHTYATYHLNIFAKPIPETGVELGLRIGQFLAGDKGVRFEVARTFKHFTLGAWFTVTDTSHFKSKFNRNYYDKGVFISIPFSVFKNMPLRGKLGFAISPWTRDPGQMVGQIRRLFPLGSERETMVELKKRLGEMRQ